MARPLPSPLRPLASRLRRAASRARFAWSRAAPRRLNLCAGEQRIPGYFNVDLDGGADLLLDLAHHDLPFADGSVDAVVCISAINYFSAPRARRIVEETHRVLRPGGVARFAVQDLRKLAALYLARDRAFFEQKLPGGADRFQGPTLADKLASWFYGYPTAGGPCRYVYDYESLALRFQAAGFIFVEERAFGSSRLPEVAFVDNRPEQMFFLEAVK